MRTDTLIGLAALGVIGVLIWQSARRNRSPALRQAISSVPRPDAITYTEKPGTAASAARLPALPLYHPRFDSF